MHRNEVLMLLLSRPCPSSLYRHGIMLTIHRLNRIGHFINQYFPTLSLCIVYEHCVCVLCIVYMYVHEYCVCVLCT